MENTVRICGVDYSDCEIVERGAHCGIETRNKTFWLFPVCDESGKEVESLPPWLPREIRAVTVEPPDLTQQFPETVRNLFDKRLAYFTRTTTREAYLTDNPGISHPPVDHTAFETGRQRILSESLEDFARDPLLRQMVWHQHGTQELADKHGYLGAVYETDEKGRRVSPRSRMDALILGIVGARRWSGDAGDDQAAAIVGKLKYEMIYEGVPVPSFIYLEEMKLQTHPARQPDVVVAVDVRASVQTHTVKEVQLIMPGWEAALKAVERGEAVAKLLTTAGESAAAKGNAAASKIEAAVAKAEDTGAVVSKQLDASAAEVSKATKIADLYSNPSYMDATDACVNREVPKEFLEYVKGLLHGGAKFPSSGQAEKALKTLPLLKALRDETDQRTTCWRWLTIIRDEFERRNLIEPRGKGKSANRASIKDPARLAAPNPKDDDEGAATDTRDSELEQDPESHDLPDRPGWAGLC